MYLENDNDNIAMALLPMRVHSGSYDCMVMSQRMDSNLKEGVATATISLQISNSDAYIKGDEQTIFIPYVCVKRVNK